MDTPADQSGYTKLWRKLLGSEVWKNHDLTRFWIWCLLKATYKERQLLRGHSVITLKPGQFVMGRSQAAAATGLSERRLRTCVKLLATLGNVTSEATSAGTVITVCNWQHYQSAPEENDQPNDQQVTSKRPASDQQVTTNKKIKKNKKDKKEKKTTPVGFADFWASWPTPHKRKTSMSRCLEKWTEDKLESRAAHVLAVLEQDKASDDWRKDEGEYICAPLVWLNQRRWDCELADRQGMSEFERPVTEAEADAIWRDA